MRRYGTSATDIHNLTAAKQLRGPTVRGGAQGEALAALGLNHANVVEMSVYVAGVQYDTFLPDIDAADDPTKYVI